MTGTTPEALLPDHCYHCHATHLECEAALVRPYICCEHQLAAINRALEGFAREIPEGENREVDSLCMQHGPELAILQNKENPDAKRETPRDCMHATCGYGRFTATNHSRPQLLHQFARQLLVGLPGVLFGISQRDVLSAQPMGDKAAILRPVLKHQVSRVKGLLQRPAAKTKPNNYVNGCTCCRARQLFVSIQSKEGCGCRALKTIRSRSTCRTYLP